MSPAQRLKRRKESQAFPKTVGKRSDNPCRVWRFKGREVGDPHWPPSLHFATIFFLVVFQFFFIILKIYCKNQKLADAKNMERVYCAKKRKPIFTIRLFISMFVYSVFYLGILRDGLRGGSWPDLKWKNPQQIIGSHLVSRWVVCSFPLILLTRSHH